MPPADLIVDQDQLDIPQTLFTMALGLTKPYPLPQNRRPSLAADAPPIPVSDRLSAINELPNEKTRNRLKRILQCVNDIGPVTTATLAKSMGVARISLFKDLNRLRKLGLLESTVSREGESFETEWVTSS